MEFISEELSDYIRLCSDEEPKLGQEILAVGFPRGDEEVTFLDGIISKKQTNMLDVFKLTPGIYNVIIDHDKIKTNKKIIKQ